MAMLSIFGFLGCIWAASRFAKAISVSPMLFEIGMGVLLGPGVLHMISPQYEVCETERWLTCVIPEPWSPDLLGDHMRQAALKCDHAAYQARDAGEPAAPGHGPLRYESWNDCLVKTCQRELDLQCERTPDIFTLIGHGGVAIMIFESGMHFNYEKFKIVGAKACMVATIGTILPLFAATLCIAFFGRPWFPDGIAAGAALAPTSCGVALKLLQEANVLKEEFGQAIMVAAFVDDVLSLFIFNVVFSLGDSGHFDYYKTVVRPSAGVVFMIVASFLAVKGWPVLMNKVFQRFVSSKDEKVPMGDQILFTTMIGVLVAYAAITHFLGNHLWGCYFAGMSFSCIQPEHHAEHVWQKQMKRVGTWMIRIFFSCTIAFSIPVKILLSPEAFWRGLIMAAGPCILTKLLSSIWIGEARWIVGWAMVGRAEFNFLIAQMAVTAGMLGEESFTEVVWSFLWATLLTPIVFRWLLNSFLQRRSLEKASIEDGFSASVAKISDKGECRDDQPSMDNDSSQATTPRDSFAVTV